MLLGVISLIKNIQCRTCLGGQTDQNVYNENFTFVFTLKHNLLFALGYTFVLSEIARQIIE